jgi:pimeloyl-ACP methyl ester carboxylesterase
VRLAALGHPGRVHGSGAVLVVSGRWDGLTTPRIAHLTWQSLSPKRARFEVLEGSAHRPWAEEPEAYFRLLDEFLSACGC